MSGKIVISGSSVVSQETMRIYHRNLYNRSNKLDEKFRINLDE